jgi:hypothetical protein
MSEIRRNKAKEIRIGAAIAASMRLHQEHKSNGDEQKYIYNNGEPSCVANFTKGLPHNYDTGLVNNPADFQQFVKGIESGEPQDFINTPLGPIGYPLPVDQGWRATAIIKQALKIGKKPITQGGKQGNLLLRAWESQTAGNLFDLEGPDAQSVTMPPAPKLGSAELTAEMGEVYVQALLRDVPFTAIVAGINTSITCEAAVNKDIPVKDILAELKALSWFNPSLNTGYTIEEPGQQQDLSSNEKSRVRKDKIGTGGNIGLSPQTLFRGMTPGDDIGPYISQFLLVGSKSLNSVDKENGRNYTDGLIAFGAQNIDQRVRIATPCKDFMTSWDAWYDVQQAADLTKTETYLNSPTRRFITTPRDLATYVHYDALYQAYLNACLILLAEGAPLDPGIPYQAENHLDHQQGFAHFGGPHILSLVTEVATRALKAVRFQKFNIHRRMRPEALAARLTKQVCGDLQVPELAIMLEKLAPILAYVDLHNKKQNAQEDDPLGQLPDGKNYLLPMAFAEGSPMHPSYGAGHATVAGACVTILKAFFDHTQKFNLTAQACKAFAPDSSGEILQPVNVVDATGNQTELTVEGELNKLASNIAIGRDWAGVHYFTDYIESLRMGEQIAIGILQEQKLTYNEPFSMTVPLFDGSALQI